MTNAPPPTRPTGPGTLVVGASQAGVQVAGTLREFGYADRLPQPRPPLSKAFLAGTADAESLELRTPCFYPDKGIRLVLGQRIEGMEFDRRLDKAVTAVGLRKTFDRLALTVGARQRRLLLPGAGLAGVGCLRTMDDSADLRAGLAAARSVVAIGGGVIGLEAAAAARASGNDQTVLETADRLIPRTVAPVVSEFYRAAHERRGTRIRLGVGVREIEGADGRVTGVVLADGELVPADVVLIGIDELPRREPALRLGLECSGGVPWFWSDQGNLKLQIAGLSTGYDELVVRGDLDDEKFSVLYYRASRLLAIDAANQVHDYLTVRRALGQGRHIPADRACDNLVPLKSLVVDGPVPAGATP